MIEVVESGDLIITVKEYDKSVQLASGQAPIVLEEEDFLVSRAVIIANSKVLAAKIKYHPTVGDIISIQNDRALRVKDMQIWLNVLHGLVFTKEAFTADMKELWYIAAAADKYAFDIGAIYPWFAGWYKLFNAQKPMYSDLRVPLYPCWRFNHAQAFLEVTRKAVYGVEGYVKDHNPTKLTGYKHSLPSRAPEQLNSVKRYLRDQLAAALFAPIEHTYSATCRCQAETEKGYNTTLYETRVWPVERVHSKLVINNILSNLSQFSYNPDMKACISCRKDYTKLVREAVLTTANYFEGLCIDCMEHSKPKTEHGDDDFWMDHPLPEDNWSRYCRITHDKTTWYYSFIGRNERREQLLRGLRSPRTRRQYSKKMAYDDYTE